MDSLFGHRWWLDDEMRHLAHVGVDVRIARTAKIYQPDWSYIGNHVAIDDYCVFTTPIAIGDYIHVAVRNTVIGGKDAKFVMEDFSGLAPNSTIVCASDEWQGAGLVSPVIPPQYRDNVICAPVVMRRFSGVASNCVVSPGVELEEGAVIGANSYVPAYKRIPAWQIWAGNPVRFIGVRKSETMIRYAKEMGYSV